MTIWNYCDTYCYRLAPKIFFINYPRQNVRMPTPTFYGGFLILQIMAENKKSFVLYCDLLTSINHLTNEEKGILFQHLLEYVNDMNPVLEDRLLLTAWKPIEIQLKRDLIKFEEVREKRSEAGKKSAEVRSVKNKSTNLTSVKSVKPRSTNPTDNVNDNDNVLLSNNNSVGGWEKVIGLFPPTKQNGLIEAAIIWNNLEQKEKQSVMRHLNPYVKNTEAQFMKQIGNYFNERMWENMKSKPSSSKIKMLDYNFIEWIQYELEFERFDEARSYLALIQVEDMESFKDLENEYKQTKNK